MPGGDAAVASPSPSLSSSVDTGSRPSIEETELNERWREILLEIDEKDLEADLAKRHSPDTLHKVFEIASAYPDSFSVSVEPMGRRNDMHEHILGDIETLLEYEHVEHRFISPLPRTEMLLKVFEVGYIYDAVYRFCSEIVVRSDIEGLEEIRFRELPEEFADWMGRVDVLWRVVSGRMPSPEEKSVEEMVESIYADRLEFIENAREKDMYLPVPPSNAETDDTDRLMEAIETRLRRNHTVDPELIYKYCYNQTLEY